MKKQAFFALIMILFFTGCTNIKEKETKSGIEVETTQVAMRVLEDQVQAIGEVKSEKEVLLSSQFAGRVVLLNVLPGDSVKAGGLVARIRSKEADAVSPSLKSEFSDISIVAPISGSVVERYVSEGNVIPQGQPIVKIIAKGRLYLLLDVSPEFYEKIKKGDRVAFNYDSSNYTGRVEAKSAAVDSLSGTLKVRVNIEDCGILPGVFVNASIITEHKFCTAVPRDAVLTRDNSQFVFVVENSVARMRYVKVGILTDKFAEILDGVKSGESVVTLGNYELEDGAYVENISSLTNVDGAE